MPRHLFATTALAVALAAPVLAQQQREPQGPPAAAAGARTAAEPPPSSEREVERRVFTVPVETTGPAAAGGGDRAPLPAGSDAEPALPVEEKLDPERARKAEEQPGAGRFIAAQEPGRLTTDEIIGTKVLNVRGEEVGEIRALLFEEGRIAAAVIGVGGFLGLGEKDVALRWDRIEAVPDGGGGDARLTVDLTRQDLERAPDFKTLADIRAEEAVKAQERSMFRNNDARSPTN